jgi:hypothetical protein
MTMVLLTGFPEGTKYEHVLNMVKWQDGFMGLSYVDATAYVRFCSLTHATSAFMKFESLPYSQGHWLTCSVCGDTSRDSDNDICDTLFIGNLYGNTGEKDELEVLLCSQLGYMRMKYVHRSCATCAFAQFQTPQHAAFARLRLQGVMLTTQPNVSLKLRYSKKPFEA